MPDIKPYFQVPEEYKNQFGPFKSLLISYDRQEIKTPQQWQQHRQEILNYWHSQMGHWPELLKEPRIESLGEEDCGTFKRIKVRIPYASAKGETLMMDAYLLIPKGDGPFPAILDLYYNPEPGAGIDTTRRDDIDFGFKLVQKGIVALCIGTPIPIRENILYPDRENPTIQPLSFMAYIAANCHTILSQLPFVKADKIGVTGHSMGGKWAMFAASLYDKFVCGCWSDPGIVFDETHADINYWEPWYIGWEKERTKTYGFPSKETPRSGAYKPIFEQGHDLVELQALMAPRPFFVSGGDCDGPKRWMALSRINEVYDLLGCPGRIGMSNRLKHKITPEDNQVIIQFLSDHLLG